MLNFYMKLKLVFSLVLLGTIKAIVLGKLAAFLLVVPVQRSLVLVSFMAPLTHKLPAVQHIIT